MPDGFLQRELPYCNGLQGYVPIVTFRQKDAPPQSHTLMIDLVHFQHSRFSLIMDLTLATPPLTKHDCLTKGQNLKHLGGFASRIKPPNYSVDQK